MSRRDFFQIFCMFYLQCITRKCAKEKKQQYLMLYQTWNRTSVYFKLALSASYAFSGKFNVCSKRVLLSWIKICCDFFSADAEPVHTRDFNRLRISELTRNFWFFSLYIADFLSHLGKWVKFIKFEAENEFFALEGWKATKYHIYTLILQCSCH